jgi:hypothetical protein
MRLVGKSELLERRYLILLQFDNLRLSDSGNKTEEVVAS